MATDDPCKSFSPMDNDQNVDVCAECQYHRLDHTSKQAYYILSGDVFKVEAVSKEQAFAMFYASQGVATPDQAAKDFGVLPFTVEDTIAVEFVETSTIILD